MAMMTTFRNSILLTYRLKLKTRSVRKTLWVQTHSLQSALPAKSCEAVASTTKPSSDKEEVTEAHVLSVRTYNVIISLHGIGMFFVC